MMVRLKPEENIATATGGLRRVQPQIREATMPPSWPPRYRDQYLRVPFTLVPLADAQWMVRRRFDRS